MLIYIFIEISVIFIINHIETIKLDTNKKTYALFIKRLEVYIPTATKIITLKMAGSTTGNPPIRKRL